MHRTAVLVAASTLPVTARPAAAAPSEGNSGQKSVVNEVVGPFTVSCEDDVEMQVTLYLTEQYMWTGPTGRTPRSRHSATDRCVYSNAAGRHGHIRTEAATSTTKRTEWRFGRLRAIRLQCHRPDCLPRGPFRGHPPG